MAGQLSSPGSCACVGVSGSHCDSTAQEQSHPCRGLGLTGAAPLRRARGRAPAAVLTGPRYLGCLSVLLFLSVMRRPNPQVSLRRPLPLVGPGPASRVCPALLSLHMFVPAGPLPAVPPTPLSCLHSVLFGDAQIPAPPCAGQRAPLGVLLLLLSLVVFLQPHFVNRTLSYPSQQSP